MTTSRDENTYMAKIAEQAERFLDMVDHIKAVAQLGVELTVDERNLLSVAYRAVTGALRSSWRNISSLEKKEDNQSTTQSVCRIRNYRERVEKELTGVCNEVLELLEKYLIPSANHGESIVFYYKMKGDYYRYLAEFSSADQRDNATNETFAAYTKSSEIAETDLAPTHPIRLGLVLNFSVFYYEIKNEPDIACQLAKRAFDDALCGLDSLDEESYKDSTLIMQLMRDNLTFWTSDGIDNDYDSDEE